MRPSCVCQTRKTGIAGGEVEFLGVARPIRNVALAVEPEHGAVGVDHGEAVEGGLAGALEKAERQHDAEFAGERGEMRDQRIAREGLRQSEMFVELILAEIGGLEQFLQQYEAGTTPGGLAHQTLGAGDISRTVPITGHLGRGDGEAAHAGLRCCPRGRRFRAAAGAQGFAACISAGRKAAPENAERLLGKPASSLLQSPAA